MPTIQDMSQMLKKTSKARRESIEAMEKKRLQARKVEEVTPAFAIKLKKAEVVKRTWEEEKIEAVDLKSHKFEAEAQAEEAEKRSSVRMSHPLKEVKISKDDLKKKKKKKKQVEVKEADVRQVEAFELPQPTKRRISQDEEKVNLDEIKLKPLKVEKVERKKLEEAPAPAPAFAELKLKKTETVKREVEKVSLEKVDLKHHETEEAPCQEAVSLLVLGLAGRSLNLLTFASL